MLIKQRKFYIGKEEVHFYYKNILCTFYIYRTC